MINSLIIVFMLYLVLVYLIPYIINSVIYLNIFLMLICCTISLYNRYNNKNKESNKT